MSAKDPGGLKAMAKRNKLVGLQKLKFFCQMCEKQCRDENGFRCHIATEAHLRQMKIFSENATGIIDDFSKQFREGYMQILSQRHGRGKIDANRVYQEYIADKQHIHMNSTMWTTLSDFVKMLGRESFCKVEESETGWQIEYIDRDPKAMARAEEEKKRKRVELDEEQRRSRFIAAQVAAANAKGGSSSSSGGSNEKEEEEEEEEVGGSLGLVRSDGDSKVSLALGTAATNQTGTGEPARKRSKKMMVMAAAAFQEEDEDEDATGTGTSASTSTSGGDAASLTTRPMVATGAAALMAEEGRRRRQARVAEDARCRHENWLHPGIVVKVTNRELGGGAFYGKKGTHYVILLIFLSFLVRDLVSVYLSLSIY
jgi:DNA/RNA-binding protein KIN17